MVKEEEEAEAGQEEEEGEDEGEERIVVCCFGDGSKGKLGLGFASDATIAPREVDLHDDGYTIT